MRYDEREDQALMPESAISAKPESNQEQATPALPAAAPAWLRWTMPSVRDLIFLVFFLSLTCGGLASRLFRDGGTGWHLRTGQIILATHAIPHADPFSILTEAKPWYAWEWLADVAMGAAFNWAGLYGIALLSALVIAVTFAFLFSMLRSRSTGLFLSVVLVLLASAAATIHLFARPHIVTWLLTLVWLQILESARRTGKVGRLICMPLLMVLWVNLHGGFVLGLILLAIYFADAVWSVLRSSDDAHRWMNAYGLTLLASGVATFLNPYGYNLHAHIYGYLTDPFLIDHIQEFQSPNFHGAAERSFVVLVLLAVMGLATSRRCLPVREILILLFAVYSGLYASRNLPVSSMLIALMIGPLWTEGFHNWKTVGSAPAWWGRLLMRLRELEGRMGSMDRNLRGSVWTLLAVIAVALASARGGALGSVLEMRAEFEPTRFPVQAVDFLVAQGVNEPVFSTDQWGGYLIYRLYPKRVLIDDRHDLYGSEFFKNYLKVIRVEPGWQAQLASMNVGQVLVPSESSLAGALEALPGWEVEYQDSTAVLLKQTVAPARP